MSELSTSIQGLQDSFVKKHPTAVWLISISASIAALTVALYAGVLPHMEKHIDDQIQIKVSDGLKEPAGRIGKMEQNLSEIQGQLKVFVPLITESLGKRIKSSLQLAPKQFKESVPELSTIVNAAREARIPMDPRIVADVGKRMFDIPVDQRESGTVWNAVQNFVNYRSWLNSSPIPISDAKPLLDPTAYLIQPSTSGAEMYNFGDVPRDQAAVLEPIGANLNKNNPRGDAFLIVSGGKVTLDDTDFRNVIFINMKVTYLGGSLKMSNVHFVNCTFYIPENQNGRQFAKVVLAEPSVVFSAT